LVYPNNPQVTNTCGPVGARLAWGLHAALGYASYVLVTAMLLLDLRLFSRKGLSDPVLRCLGWGLILLAIDVGIHLLPLPLPDEHIVGHGGYVGAVASTLLQDQFSTGGTGIIVATVAVAGMLMASETTLLALVLTPVLVPLRPLGRRIFRRWLQQTPAGNPVSPAATPAKAAPRIVEPPPAATAAQPPVKEPRPSLLSRLISSQPQRDIRINPPAGMRSSCAAGEFPEDEAFDQV